MVFRYVLIAVLTVCFVHSMMGAAFIKFDGIDGEALDPDYQNHSDVLSWSWGAFRPLDPDDTTQTRRRGAAVAEDFIVTKALDKSSPKLFEKCLKGEVIPKVEVFLTKSTGGGRVEYIVFELRVVSITSVSTGGSGGATALTENVSLKFEEVTYTYTEFDDSGTNHGNVEVTWKVEEGQS